MRILNYLCDNCIDPDFRAVAKEDALKKLASKAALAVGGVDARVIFKVLSEREGLGSTAIGKGIAIPHGKIPGLKKIAMLVFRCKEGVPFESADSRPVFVIVLLLAPDDATTAYLKVLARVSRALKMDGMVERIKDAGNVAEIKQILAEAEARL